MILRAIGTDELCSVLEHTRVDQYEAAKGKKEYMGDSE